jgi:hypothetical protein
MDKKKEKECKCISSNRPKEWQEDEAIVLDPNKYFDYDSKAKKVSVDYCIADVIKYLWENGIWTVGSCCGHNKSQMLLLKKISQKKKLKI